MVVGLFFFLFLFLFPFLLLLYFVVFVSGGVCCLGWLFCPAVVLFPFVFVVSCRRFVVEDACVFVSHFFVTVVLVVPIVFLFDGRDFFSVTASCVSFH